MMLITLTIVTILLLQAVNINRKVNELMATKDEQTAKLNAIGDRLDKATAEILAAIQALKDAQANAGNTTAEEDTATARLEKAAEGLDAVNPDAAPAPEPPPV